MMDKSNKKHIAKSYETISSEIATKLASDKPEGVAASDHRETSQDILDYAKEIKDNIPSAPAGIKHVVLNRSTWNYNDSFMIGDDALFDKQILTIQIFLVAKREINNMNIGALTQVFNGYERGDGGGIPSQGISAAHNPGSAHVHIQTASEIYVYPNNIRVEPEDYSIRVVVLYV